MPCMDAQMPQWQDAKERFAVHGCTNAAMAGCQGVAAFVAQRTAVSILDHCLRHNPNFLHPWSRAYAVFGHPWPAYVYRAKWHKDVPFTERNLRHLRFPRYDPW